MSKYRKKPVIVDARVFEWGMEHGVMRYNEFIPRDAAKFSVEMRSAVNEGYLSRYENELEERGFERGEWQPYIETIHAGQKVVIQKGDYIIKEPDGVNVYPCKPDIFEKTYEAVE